MKVLDIGCGPGIYVRALRDLGFEADGVDLDPRCPYDKVNILSDEFTEKYAGKYDLAVCLEVAEHLSPDDADELVEKIVSVAPIVLFSAAVVGQGGHGHINCQPKEYWVEKFADHNYVVDSETTEDLVGFMQSGYHLGWFTQNAVVFRKYGDVCYDRIIQEETPQAERLAQWFQKTSFK